MEQFNTVINQNLGWVHEHKYVLPVLSLFLGMYVALARPKLPSFIAKLFENPVFRLVVIAYIIYRGNKDPRLSLMIAAAFLITMHMINKQQIESLSGEICDVDGTEVPCKKIRQVCEVDGTEVPCKEIRQYCEMDGTEVACPGNVEQFSLLGKPRQDCDLDGTPVPCPPLPVEQFSLLGKPRQSCYDADGTEVPCM